MTESREDTKCLIYAQLDESDLTLDEKIALLEEVRKEHENKTELVKQYNKQKREYKKKLHDVLKDCNFNGAGTRQLLQEFTDEVCGS